MPVIAVLPLLLLTTFASAQQSEVPAPFAGHDPAWWVEQLRNDSKRARQLLAPHGATALPLLRWLLDHDDEHLRHQAAKAMANLGPLARPVRKSLLERLRNAREGSDDAYVEALTAIGDFDPALREILLHHAATSPSHLRFACVRALFRLTPDAASILLDAVASGDFPDPESAIELLADGGGAAVTTLLGAVDGDAERARVARESLVRMGWTVASRLERAGHLELAHRAMTEQMLHEVTGCEQYRIEPPTLEPPAQRLPELRFTFGWGHGDALTLWRAAECERGFRIRSLSVADIRELGDEQPRWSLGLRELVVPRQLALEMTRQLRVLSRIELRQHADELEHWWSSGDFTADVHAEFDGETLLEACFAGYPTGDNVPQRFRAEAARNVLLAMTRGLTWSERLVDDDDRAMLAAARDGRNADTRWVEERLQAIDNLLHEAR